MHRGSVQVIIQRLEVIEPRDLLVERSRPSSFAIFCSAAWMCSASIAWSNSSAMAALSASTVSPVGDTSAKPPRIDDLHLAAVALDRENAGPQRRDHRRVSGEHAEIALGAGHVDLLDFTGQKKPLGRDEIELKGGHMQISAFYSFRPRAKR